MQCTQLSLFDTTIGTWTPGGGNPEQYNVGIDMSSSQDMTTVRVWTVEEIRCLLQTSDKMVTKSLLQLYAKQTSYERQARKTLTNNNVGFNSPDSPILTQIAQLCQLQGNELTNEQLWMVKRRIGKYAKQLTRIANNEI